MTSSKLRFDRDGLRAAIEADYDRRIASAEADLREAQDPEHHAALAAEWRADAEAQISAFFRTLGTATNAQIEGFRIRSAPKLHDDYALRRLRDEPAALRSLKARSLAKVDAVRPDADGALAVTATQMSDFFGLR